MKLNYLIAFLLVALSFTSLAQSYELNKTNAIPYDSGRKKHKNKLFLRLYNNRSEVNNTQLRYSGIKLGIEHNKKLRFGVTYTSLADSVFILREKGDAVWGDFIDVVTFGGFTEYIIVKNYRVELSIPLDIGFGSAKIAEASSNRKLLSELQRPNYFLTQLSVYGQYNINYWLGFGAGLGFRYTRSENKTLQDAMTSPFFIFGMKANVFKALTTIVNHKRVLDEKIEYFEGRNYRKAEKLKRRRGR